MNYDILQSEHIDKCQCELCSKCDSEYDFDVIIGSAVICRKLKWIYHKHSKNIVRHEFLVASVVTFYHDHYIPRSCNTRIYSLTTHKVLRHATPFLVDFVRYVIKNLFHEYLHFTIF